MSGFSSTAMLSLRLLMMSAGDLWDLPKGKGMVESYLEQQDSGLSTWGTKCKTGSKPCWYYSTGYWLSRCYLSNTAPKPVAIGSGWSSQIQWRRWWQINMYRLWLRWFRSHITTSPCKSGQKLTEKILKITLTDTCGASTKNDCLSLNAHVVRQISNKALQNFIVSCNMLFLL